MALSATDKLVLERIDHDYNYFRPEGLRISYHERLRAAAKDYARLIVELCPEGRERSVALTNLEQTLMWANAAVARHVAETG